MKNLVISDEEGGIHLYAGMVVSESDLETLEGILERVFWKMKKLEKHAETSKVLEELKGEVATLAQRQNLNRKAHTRIYKEIGDHSKAIEDLQYSDTEDVEAIKKIEKRLTDIEEFLEDL